MKPIKMLGLAALVALMAMAFVGASSAMAETTALCGSDASPCGSPLTHVHETTSTKAKIEAEGIPTVECNVLFLSAAAPNGVLNSGLATTLIIHGTFTYSSCNNFCSVTEGNGPAEIKVLRTGSELASVTWEYEMHVLCPFYNCWFIGTDLEGHDLGALSTGGNGSVIFPLQELLLVSGSEICPSQSFLTITLKPLSATYISS